MTDDLRKRLEEMLERKSAQLWDTEGAILPREGLVEIIALDLLREVEEAKATLEATTKKLEGVIAFPPVGYSRRTEDGYPSEFVYDQFAYERMVDSYRKAIRHALPAPPKENDHEV